MTALDQALAWARECADVNPDGKEAALLAELVSRGERIERLTREAWTAPWRASYFEMRAERDGMRAEVERLTSERDEWKATAETLTEHETMADLFESERDRADAAEARADRLQQALEQIADASYVGNYGNLEVIAIYREWARAALAAAADTETPGHLYNGSFELSWLADDEMVLSAGDGSGACEIAWEPDGRLLCRLEVGDRLKRGEDGRPIAIRPAGAEQQT